MDTQTLLTALDFARARLLGTIEAIEKSGQDTAKVLAWRPGPGRAHIAWQLMHCATVFYRNLHAWQNLPVPDETLVKNYGGGSTPSDQNIPSLATIKQTLESTFAPFRQYIAGINANELTTRKVGPPDRQRTLAEWIVLYTWHEAHHQGQIHLSWNMYKAAHGVK